MKKHFSLLLFTVISVLVFSQTETTVDAYQKPFRIAIEPTNFVAQGFSLFASYGITKDRNLHVGLYTLKSTLPDFLKTKIFNNVTSEDKIKLTFELATTFRYKIPYNLKGESNPYIGVFVGWEKFEHTDATTQQLTSMSNFFITPQIGYEIYIFRQMIYLDPGVRLVYEFGRKSDYSNPSDTGDPGPEITNFVFLPSIAIGIRL